MTSNELSGSIGGYIGLPRRDGRPWHPGAVACDLGRHALELILLHRGVQRLHVPRYTCDVLAPVFQRRGVELVPYRVDVKLDPVLHDVRSSRTGAVLYTNYFGLKADTVLGLADKVPHLIVDNAMDFYGPVPEGADAFVSCRKFFGVPDGSYAISAATRDVVLDPAPSFGRLDHLLMALDGGIEAGFERYQQHERELARAPLKGMSRMTSILMAQVDHEQVMSTRRSNRDRLHAALAATNLLPIDPAAAQVPMVYPYHTADKGLRARLQAARIYVPRYWPGVLEPLTSDDGGRPFQEDVLYLPVDQRYGPAHMDRIIEVVLDGR